MPSTIHIVRHAESAHNVSKDFSHRDPPLTSLGFTQAATLSQTVPNPSNIAVMITSPLSRAIQTTLSGFGTILDERYYSSESGKGVANGAKLLLDPELQERSAEPCDTGSSAAELEAEFPGLDFRALGQVWPAKTGGFAADDEAVSARAGRMRGSLRKVLEGIEDGEGKRRDAVVVTHGVFMKFLTGDQEIDLPKAGFRSFELQAKEDGTNKLVLKANGNSQ